jgi:hypothetical protein
METMPDHLHIFFVCSTHRGSHQYCQKN